MRLAGPGPQSQSGQVTEQTLTTEQNMTIQDYIKKHGLTLWRTWPTFGAIDPSWIPVFFLTEEIGGKAESRNHLEKYEIYANPEKTRFVSMNVTRGLFRIVHYELIVITSEWQPSHPNYELQALS